MRKQKHHHGSRQNLPSQKDPVSSLRHAWNVANRWPILLFAVAGFALLLRLVYLKEMSGTPFFAVLIGDGKAYDEWAQRIAGGQWIGSEVFYQTPLYPYFLAAVFKLAGHRLIVARLVQVTIGALSCVLVGLAGKRFFNQKVAVIAALLLAIYPPAIFFDGLIQKSVLDLFLITLILVAIGEFRERQRLKWLIVMGLALAAFTLNRENARILYPILVVWILIYFRPQSLAKRTSWAVALTLSMAALLAPVAIRNYYVGGEFLVSTSQLGPNLYIGNHAGARGSYEPLVPGHGNAEFERNDAKQLAERAIGKPLSPSQVSDYWVGRSIEYMRSQPGSWLRLLGRKLLLAINAKEAVDTESIEAYSEYSFVLRSLRWMNFGVLLTLAAIGVWLMRDAARRVFILYLMFAAMVLSTALFFVVARYRYPLVPFVVLFAAGAISFIPNFRRLSRAQIVVAAVVGIGCAILVSLPLKALGDETFLNVGEELVRLNQPAQALPLLRRAVSIAPTSPAPHYNLGLALRQIGNRETSLNEFNEAIRLNPNYFEAHAAKALTLADSGRQTEALVEFREALRLRPDSATTHVGLADSLVNMGDNSDAIVEYQKATELAPELFEAHYRLAQAYVRTNQFAQAVDSLQKALAIANAQGKNELARQIQNGIEMCRARMREENR